MALAEKYIGKEIPCFDILTATTNQAVCKWCLQHDCDGDTCGPEDADMASAKESFTTTGLAKSS